MIPYGPSPCSDHTPGMVCDVLEELSSGSPGAADRLLPLIYDQLRRIAQKKMADESPGQTLNATALVHEAFIRLVGAKCPQTWENAGHFYSAAAEAMRRILIEVARRKNAIKYGGRVNRLELDALAGQCEIDSREWAADLLDLDQALRELSNDYPEMASLVELRYFAGLSMQEAAKALEISRRTAQRHWAFARAWLYRRVHHS